MQEEQVARVRQGMSERVQQLESQIQGKLEQARERRETIEREQKEKLRNHVSFSSNVTLVVDVVVLNSTSISNYQIIAKLCRFWINKRYINLIY